MAYPQDCGYCEAGTHDDTTWCRMFLTYNFICSRKKGHDGIHVGCHPSSNDPTRHKVYVKTEDGVQMTGEKYFKDKPLSATPLTQEELLEALLTPKPLTRRTL